MHRWTDQERDEALRIYRVDGPSEAARQTGIPRNTISSWANRSGDSVVLRENMQANCIAAAQRWAAKREELLAQMGDVAQLALDRAKGALRDEKAQLVSGGATSRPNIDPLALIAEAKGRALNLVPQRNTG
jgi:hypothetical protein